MSSTPVPSWYDVDLDFLFDHPPVVVLNPRCCHLLRVAFSVLSPRLRRRLGRMTLKAPLCVYERRIPQCPDRAAALFCDTEDRLVYGTVAMAAADCLHRSSLGLMCDLCGQSLRLHVRGLTYLAQFFDTEPRKSADNDEVLHPEYEHLTLH